MSNAAKIPPFVAPLSGSVDILFIAGEHSGDQHAAKLVNGLLLQKPDLRIAAVGGPEMAKAGAQLLVDLTEFSVVGFVEVLKHASQFRRLIDNVTDWVCQYKPKVVCFVDYPGFNLRVAKRLFDSKISRKAGGQTALFYYISPQIWAWKSRRRFEMAKLLDALAVIFPFEVDCYADTTLDVRFVGHPFVTEGRESNLTCKPEAPVLLLPGSRVQPVSRIFPAMLDGFACYTLSNPSAKAVVLYPDATIRSLLEDILLSRGDTVRNVELRDAKDGAEASACLISSGTMSLNCALAAIPGAVCYRAHPITYALGRLLVRVPYLGIANLLMPETPPYPEFLQNAASPSCLADALEAASGAEARERMSVASAMLRARLSMSGATNPVAWMLSFTENN